MDRVHVEGLSIAYQRAGQGPPLVLLHGYVADGPTAWRPQFEALCDEFTVVAWDAPGAGASSDPPESFGMAGYADCLASFLRALGLAQAHIVGLSFGGALALELYRRHPPIPRTLVLASAYAGWMGSLPAGVAQARLEQAVRLSALPSSEFVATLLPTMFGPSVAPEDVDAFRAAMTAFHPIGFRAMARASAEDLSAIPPTVTIPTLLLYGDRDERAPLFVAERLHDDIADSRLVVLEGAGHCCNLEAAQGFSREVSGFLAEHA